MLYAMRILKADLALITLLNDGVTPKVEHKKKSYFIFGVSDEGRSITTDIISERELAQRYDIAGISPFVVRLKEA